MPIQDSLHSDNVSIGSDRSSVASVISLKQHHNLRAECVKLKMELAKIISMSKGHSQHDREMKCEIDALRKENERLSHENKHLRGKVENMTGNDSLQANQEQIGEDLGGLKTKLINHRDSPLSHEVADIIEKIRESISNQLNQAASERYDLEVKLKLMESQRNDWKFEAEQLAIEMNEMKERNSRMEKTVQSMDAEREDWKSMVEQLGIELNETKRQNEDLLSRMCRKEEELMEMMNNINEETNSVVNQKNKEIMELVGVMQSYTQKVGSSDKIEMLMPAGNHEGSLQVQRGTDVEPSSFVGREEPLPGRSMASCSNCSHHDRHDSGIAERARSTGHPDESDVKIKKSTGSRRRRRHKTAPAG